MKIFRSRNTSEADMPHVIIDTEMGSAESVQPGIEDFTQKYTPAIEYSATLWDTIPKLLNTFQNEEYAKDLSIGVANCLRLTAGSNNELREPTDEETTNATTLLLENLSVLWVFAARGLATQDMNFKERVGEIQKFTHNMPNGNVAHAVGNVRAQLQFKLQNRFSRAIDEIRTADQASESVLQKMAQEVLSDPAIAKEAAEVMAEPASREDAHLLELKRMIDVDWFRPDTDKSVLRQHIANLRANPHLLLDAFCRDIAESSSDGKDHKLDVARDMAHFALLNIQREFSPDSVAQLFTRNVDMWQRIDTLRSTFEGYAHRQTDVIESSVAEIAGKPRPEDVRTHRDRLYLENVLLNTQVFVPYANRADRKRRGGNSQRAKADMRYHTALVGAIRETGEGQEPVERALFLAVNGRVEPFECVEDVVAHFTNGNKVANKELENDLRTIFEHLQTTPNFMTGLKKMTRSTLRVGGKQLALWRFAPDKCPGLRVTSANRFYRAVFAFDGQRLILDFVGPHDRFDQKYPR